ncbi:MAG TPA: MFS transporter [Candidatus Binatia bacterium]|nr:MFS transporter [Candidatus Binatia bacterium]
MNPHEHNHENDKNIPASMGSHSTLTLVSLAHGINHAQSALKPLVFPLVLRELNFGYSELGIVLGVASAVGGSLQLVAGALGRLLPRHYVLGTGNAAVGVCLVLVGLAQSYSQFFLWTVLSRVGGAAQHPVGASLISHHFNKKRLGIALATHFTAGNIGTAIIPLCAAIMIGLWGWRFTTILFAIPAILVGLAMCIWLKDPATQKPVETRQPKTTFWQDSSDAIGNRSLRWILVAASVAAGGSGHGIIASFLPLYLSHHLEMSAPMVGVIFTLTSVGSIVGPLLGGKLADRYHPQRALIFGYSVSAAAALVLPWLGANFIGVASASFVLGTAAFSTHPILQTLVAQTSSGRLRDTGFAWFYTATFLAGAIWSPTVGYLSDWLGLKAAFGTMATSFVLAIACVLLGRLREVAFEHEQDAVAHSYH